MMILRLKEIREKHDLKQRQMADKLKISKSTYNYFETGERIIYHYILINDNGQEKEIQVDIDQNSSNGSKFNFVIK